MERELVLCVNRREMAGHSAFPTHTHATPQKHTSCTRGVLSLPQEQQDMWQGVSLCVSRKGGGAKVGGSCSKTKSEIVAKKKKTVTGHEQGTERGKMRR